MSDSDRPIPPEEWCKLKEHKPQVRAKKPRYSSLKDWSEAQEAKSETPKEPKKNLRKTFAPKTTDSFDVARAQTLRDAGMLSLEEIAKLMGVTRQTVGAHTDGWVGRKSEADIALAHRLDLQGLSYA